MKLPIRLGELGALVSYTGLKADPYRDCGSCGSENVWRARWGRYRRELIMQSPSIYCRNQRTACSSISLGIESDVLLAGTKQNPISEHDGVENQPGLDFVNTFGHKTIQAMCLKATGRAWQGLSSLRPALHRACLAPSPGLVLLSAHTYRVMAFLTEPFKCYSSVRERKISPCSSSLPPPCLAPLSCIGPC